MTTWTVRGSRLAWGIGCLAAATVLALGCSDSTAPTTSGTPSPTSFVVSSPVLGTSAVVYVSLPPGATPLGQSATIRNLRLGSAVTATFINGGFDPVALPAAVGDTLVLSVLDSGATVPVSHTRVVPDGEPPIVVRTSPTPHKRDVPLNARMVVVFSEPIDSATLAPGSIQLSHQSVPVPGHLAFGDPLHLTVAFTPDSALSPLTDYQLTVTAADGAPLTTPVRVPFTTGTSSIVGRFAFVVQPTQVTAGKVMSPAVQVIALNAAGVRDSTYTGPITIAIGHDASGGVGVLSGGLQVSAVYGLATFSDLSIDKVNSLADTNGTQLYTLTASATGFADATSSGFAVTPSVATRLTLFYQPSDALVGLPMWAPVDVAARDAEGNYAPGPTGNITVALGSNPGGGTLSGTTVAQASGSVGFQFRDLRIDRAGSGYTLVVTWGGLTTTSTPFTVFQPSQLIAFVSAGTGLSFVDAVSGGMARADGNASSWPAWSPDGMKIALMGFPPAGEEFGSIEVMNADGSGVVSLGQSGERPAWSPDGTRIAFGGVGGIYVMNSDGTGVTQLVSPGSDPAWSPDGARIAFGGAGGIYVMNSDGTGVTGPTSGLGGMWPAWSPDGTRIAFSTGTAGFYVMNADGTSVTQITANTGWAPSWSPDGTTLAFAGPDEGAGGIARIYVVSLDGTGLRPLTRGLVTTDGSSEYWSSNSEPAWRPAPHP